MPVRITIVGTADRDRLAFAPGLLDRAPDRNLLHEFLDDPRHHLAVAREDGRVIGFASAVHYVHPDKPCELWINEVGVIPEYRSQGIARDLLRRLLAHGRALGCRNAWVLTEQGNAAARQLYRALGGIEHSDAVMVTFNLRALESGPEDKE